jgi:hypothetical protein
VPLSGSVVVVVVVGLAIVAKYFAVAERSFIA